MLSEYAQVQLFITAYFLAVAVAGAWGVELCCPRREQPLFPVPLPQQRLLQEPPPADILWALAGWYKLQSGEYAPLFCDPHTHRWVYVHKGTLVHPTEAAVRRRGISHPPPINE
jgi:hypothetical protein